MCYAKQSISPKSNQTKISIATAQVAVTIALSQYNHRHEQSNQPIELRRSISEFYETEVRRCRHQRNSGKCSMGGFNLAILFKFESEGKSSLLLGELERQTAPLELLRAAGTGSKCSLIINHTSHLSVVSVGAERAA